MKGVIDVTRRKHRGGYPPIEPSAAAGLTKIILCVLLVLATCAIACAESDFEVNGKPLTDYSVDELYELEDALVDALKDVFRDQTSGSTSPDAVGVYVVNLKTHKFHYPFCYSALQIGSDGRIEVCTASELVKKGYKPCGHCKPYRSEE